MNEQKQFLPKHIILQKVDAFPYRCLQILILRSQIVYYKNRFVLHDSCTCLRNRPFLTARDTLRLMLVSETNTSGIPSRTLGMDFSRISTPLAHIMGKKWSYRGENENLIGFNARENTTSETHLRFVVPAGNTHEIMPLQQFEWGASKVPLHFAGTILSSCCIICNDFSPQVSLPLTASSLLLQHGISARKYEFGEEPQRTHSNQ